MEVGNRPTSRHLKSTIPHHRFIAIFLFTALCLTIVVTVVWKTTSKTCQAALDTDCHQQQLTDGVHESKPEHVTEGADCHGQPSTETIHDGLQSSEARDEPPEDSPAVAETVVRIEEKYLEECYEQALKDTFGDYDVALNAERMRILKMEFDSTVASYAVDEHGRPHDWVLRGPDMFDKVCLYDNKSGNLASRRFMWLAHMNRKNETTSLYDQLGIDQSCSDSWVQTAIKTAQEIRLQIMGYFVFYAVNALTCDLGPWDSISHEAPDIVQHRMQVFIAKLEYLKPFHYLRLVTQNVCDDPYPWGYFKEYFRYRHELQSWLQKYEHLREEVEELSFEGCTRVFTIADDPDRAYNFILNTLDNTMERLELLSNLYPECLSTLQCKPDIPLLIYLCIDSCKTAYEMLDQLPEPIQDRLNRLKEMKAKQDSTPESVPHPDIL